MYRVKENGNTSGFHVKNKVNEPRKSTRNGPKYFHFSLGTKFGNKFVLGVHFHAHISTNFRDSVGDFA